MEKLIHTLNDLKENRRLSSECEAIISPFIGKTFESKFSFKEASSTFASRLGDEFKGGKTVIAEITESGLECSILFPESKNEWIRELKPGDDIDVRVNVLEFDNLYQRVVFGHTEQNLSDEDQTEKVSESVSKEPSKEVLEAAQNTLVAEVMDDKVTVEKPEITKDESHPRDSVTSEEQKELITDTDKEPIPEQYEINLEETVSTGCQEGEVAENSINEKDDGTKLPSDRPKQKDIDENRRDVPPPLPPPLPKIEAMQTHDPAYLEQLRDKRYEHGPDSLTEEEKEALAQDLRANTASRQKELKKNKEKVNKGARAFFGFIMMIFSLNACSEGGGFFAFVVFSIGAYLLIPFLKKLKEINDI